MCTVMIADDERLIRTSIIKTINWDELKMEVVAEASDGINALRIFEETRPFIVLIDIRMPLLDGLGVIKTLRQKGHVHTHFIVISGYDDFDYAKRAIKLGVSDYIQKPVDSQELTAALLTIRERIRAVHPEHEYSTDDESSINKVKKLIHKNYRQELTLHYCANHCHLNPSYLSQLFKSKTGVNISRYIENIRLEKAKELLEEGALSVIEVSSAIGYNDSNYFSKVFKKQTGMSPSEYKKRVTRGAL